VSRSWKLERKTDTCWEIPADAGSGRHVPARIYASEKLLSAIRRDESLTQVANICTLPGVRTAALAMPDIHFGYGFPIGGVAAMDYDEGVVSPGGVGFDINCGVRLVRSDLVARDLVPGMAELVEALFCRIPCGTGRSGELSVSAHEWENLLEQGAAWVVRRGFGRASDLENCESSGRLRGADPALISGEARRRGADQLGTLGSGNHFVEVQECEEVYAEDLAAQLGIFEGQLTVMIHSGSRGLGHQVCTDFLRVMGPAVSKYGLKLPDRQLACAPVKSPEGRQYLAAMAGAANYAWANRQMLMHLVRVVFEKFLGQPADRLGLDLVYDVAHNIAKVEEHLVDGRRERLVVHRKGATRAFGPGHPELPERYRTSGQPVLIPGDMGTASYLLVGTAGAMAETFGSCCHGAGRALSRSQAKKSAGKRSILDELTAQGVTVRGASRRGLVEEMPDAYKDIHEVVRVAVAAGLARQVARFRPIGVIKG
jgi:tRNA-splicing ligase RtcB (3'-phosphate/5'-hydroxy nucleic acid ligase)